MKIGMYLCECGGAMAGTLDFGEIRRQVAGLPEVAYVHSFALLCPDEGLHEIVRDLRAEQPDRVVIAACSPREREPLFHRTLEKAGINPYLLQMANIREQVAWVTRDRTKATEKAVAVIRGAVARVRLHQPLEKKSIPVCPDVMVIGAGPAGLSAAQTLAESGRRVILVEKSPVAGGLPSMFEELFPDRECGPCLMQPLLDTILHGECAGSIELLTLAQVVSLRGYFGNFMVTLEQQPRFVDAALCVGCGECVAACPATTSSAFNGGPGRRKAIDFPSPGALPHLPRIDAAACLRMKDKECSKCRDACPVAGAIVYGDTRRRSERRVGAIVVATGASLLECGSFTNLGYRRLPDVVTALEFERMLASDGPRKGTFGKSARMKPARVAIIHCVGSLDAEQKPYCSSICCRYALKYRAMIRDRLPGSEVLHFVKEWCVPGQAAQPLFSQAQADRRTRFVRYRDLASLRIAASGNRKTISCADEAGARRRMTVDMIVLCPAVVPGRDAAELAAVLGIPCDEHGFFGTERSTPDAIASPVRGIFAAGACHAPMDIRSSANEGRAAAGRLLAELKPEGRREITPITAEVDPANCSGCMLCPQTCPFAAIILNPSTNKAIVLGELCDGCGICVAACPAGAITGRHFTGAILAAELTGVLDESRK